jgi:hypothetical protein
MTSGVIETVDIIDPWLYATLSGDATLLGLINGANQLVSTLGSGNVATPYVQWFQSSTRDVLAVGGIRVQVDTLYTVKAVATGASWSVVRPIARRVDFLLNGKDVTVSSPIPGQISCRRESIVQYPEVEQAEQFRHLGGVYRIRANAL